jgi:hypothetical protein
MSSLLQLLASMDIPPFTIAFPLYHGSDRAWGIWTSLGIYGGGALFLFWHRVGLGLGYKLSIDRRDFLGSS